MAVLQVIDSKQPENERISIIAPKTAGIGAKCTVFGA
jgi:hypothetical protein